MHGRWPARTPRAAAAGCRRRRRWWRSCSRATWAPVSRTNSTDSRNAVDGDRGSGDDEDVARSELGREPAAQPSGERDAAVAGGLVQPEREAAALGTDEVDLHHDGHRPGEALVDAEQDVGGDDPAPARRDRDQHRHRQRHRPAGDQQPPPAGALRERTGAEVGQRLDQPEGDDERQHRRVGGEVEVVAPDQRQRRALEADHRADEGVDRDEQRELRDVLAQPELDRAGRSPRPQGLATSRRPERLAATIAACCSGAGGMSLVRAATNSSSEENCSAVLWRRSKPTRRDRVGREAAAADRAGVVRRDRARRWSGSVSSRSVSDR